MIFLFLIEMMFGKGDFADDKYCRFWEGRQLLGMFRKDDEMARTATLALEH